jgi:alpha-glucosidase
VYYKDGTEASVVYDDGGEGYGYKEGHSTTRNFTVTGTETSLTLTQVIEGDYQPSFTTYKVVLHGLPFTGAQVTADSAALEVEEHLTDTGLTLPSIVVGVEFGEIVVKGKVALAAS